MSGERRPDVPFRLVDHTADVAIEARGATPEETLCAAAEALAAVICGRSERLGPDAIDAEGATTVPITAHGADAAGAAVAFLAEVLWAFESRGLLWAGGDVRVEERDGQTQVEGTMRGVAYDAGRHGYGVEVKAVTYHDVRFEQPSGGAGDELGSQTRMDEQHRGGRHGGNRRDWRLWVVLDL